MDSSENARQTAHFSDSFFLKVSVDQFPQNLYIPIRDPQDGGADISSFQAKKTEIRGKFS
jgi:hypothetical protein